MSLYTVWYITAYTTNQQCIQAQLRSLFSNAAAHSPSLTQNSRKIEAQFTLLQFDTFFKSSKKKTLFSVCSFVLSVFAQFPTSHIVRRSYQFSLYVTFLSFLIKKAKTYRRCLSVFSSFFSWFFFYIFFIRKRHICNVRMRICVFVFVLV